MSATTEEYEVDPIVDCNNYDANIFFTDCVMTAFFFLGTYFPLIFCFRVLSAMRLTVKLRYFGGVCVQGRVVAQRRIVVARSRRRVGHELFIVTIRYPANNQFSQDCVKYFEVSPWDYARCSEDPLSLNIVRDPVDPRISKLSSRVFGCCSPVCVAVTLTFYALLLCFVILWNIMLYRSKIVCHAPIWSIPFAIVCALYTLRKDNETSKNSAVVAPTDATFPEAQIVEAGYQFSLETHSSRTMSGSSLRIQVGVSSVPVADEVLNAAESAPIGVDTKENVADEDGDRDASGAGGAPEDEIPVARFFHYFGGGGS